MTILKRDAFGKILFIKRWLIRILGIISYRRHRGINELRIEGSEFITQLPEKNVLFVSNHQTYFADATAMIHVFNASLNGKVNNIDDMSYLWNLKLNIYFIAAKETMKSGIIPKILAYTGSISINRTWKEKGIRIKRDVNKEDVNNVNKALKEGWLITFPQGTTKKGAPIRKGTAHIIKENQPIVVPIVINGFRQSFDKTGLKIKERGIQQSMRIKKPIYIDYENETIEQIVSKIACSIEQSPSVY